MTIRELNNLGILKEFNKFIMGNDVEYQKVGEPMTDQERDRYLKEFEDFTEELSSSSKEEQIAFFVRAGIFNEDGTLTDRYISEAKD